MPLVDTLNFNGKGENIQNMPKKIGNCRSRNLLMGFGFFLAQIDPIELKLFSLNQASRDTSLEYQQAQLGVPHSEIQVELE